MNKFIYKNKVITSLWSGIFLNLSFFWAESLLLGMSAASLFLAVFMLLVVAVVVTVLLILPAIGSLVLYLLSPAMMMTGGVLLTCSSFLVPASLPPRLAFGLWCHLSL